MADGSRSCLIARPQAADKLSRHSQLREEHGTSPVSPRGPALQRFHGFIYPAPPPQIRLLTSPIPAKEVHIPSPLALPR